jgi:alanine racemase
MPRPIQAYIHTEALTHNLLRAKAMSPSSRAWAVVKANAYGHGIERVYGAFAKACDGFALLDLAEAKRVRACGWTGRILLLEGFFQTQDLMLCESLRLSFTVHCAEQIAMLEKYAGAAQFDVFLKMNSGMNRLGFVPSSYRAVWQRLRALACVKAITHMTHFSDADGPRGIAHQLATFNAATEGLPGERSLANSGATCNYADQIRSDWIRPGIMLYGSSPMGLSPTAKDLGLRATMSLTSEIIGIQQLHAGDAVGYGSSFVADRELRIGVVACGYADGYMRLSPTGTPVIVGGIRTRTVGRVSMDMITVDLTPCPEAGIGTSVELWGETLSIDEVAAASGTVSYELMCGLTQRVPVRVV